MKKIKNIELIKKKFFKLLKEYTADVDAAIVPPSISGTFGKLPDKHPFEDAPKEVLDDENFLLKCFKIDDAECFQFASLRLRNKKTFVMKALVYAYPEQSHIGDKIKYDFDIILDLSRNQLKDFSKYGKKILNDKNKLYKIIKNTNFYGDKHGKFKSYKSIPNRIRSDKNFFIKLLKLNHEHTYGGKVNYLAWANKNVLKDKKIINLTKKCGINILSKY
jgi:hypothetical protein